MSHSDCPKRNGSGPLPGGPSEHSQAGKRYSEQPYPLSSLEALPTEILEQIFLASTNGNLLLAAPRIAARLSGNETVYRAVFALTFYSHRLGEVLNGLEISSIVPDTEHPLGLWDIRSLTKAILRASWCTCGWIRSTLDVLAKNVIFDTSFNLIHGHGTEEHIRHEKHSHLLGIRARFLQCHLLAFDRNICRSILLSSNQDKLLKTIMQKALQRTDESGPPQHAVWPCFDKIQFDRENQANSWYSGSAADAGEWVRTLVARDYYLHPEDFDFTIRPEVFRRAAIHDLEFSLNEAVDQIELWPPLNVHRLFDIDPYSLPRKDPILLLWAERLTLDLQRYINNWKSRRDYLVNQAYPVPWNWCEFARSTFSYQRRVKILRYIKTGYLDRVSERHLTDLSGRLEPTERFPDRILLSRHATTAEQCSDEAFIHRGIPPPHPNDLSFLSHSDFENAGRAIDHMSAYSSRQRRREELHALQEQRGTYQLQLDHAPHGQWNLDVSGSLAGSNVVEDFDFDSFLNGPDGDPFAYDPLSATLLRQDRAVPDWYISVPSPFSVRLS